MTIANNYLDRDLSNNAIIPSALTIWYNNVVLKAISNQIDNIAPVIASSTLAGTYSFDTINHTITLTESSMLAASGMSITV